MAQFRVVSPKSADWYVQVDGSANTAISTCTKAAVTGKSHYICGVSVACTTTNTTNVLTVALKDGTTAVLKQTLPAALTAGAQNLFLAFPAPIKMTVSTLADLTVSATAGGGVVSTSMWGYTA